MAERPTQLPQWAENDIEEVVTINGSVTLVTNKVEPTFDFKSSGSLARQPLPRPYLNWFFNFLGVWIKHLDERVAVGDFKLVATTETATTMNSRFGGTWTDHGLETFAGQSVRVFERVV